MKKYKFDCNCCKRKSYFKVLSMKKNKFQLECEDCGALLLVSLDQLQEQEKIKFCPVCNSKKISIANGIFKCEKCGYINKQD